MGPPSLGSARPLSFGFSLINHSFNCGGARVEFQPLLGGEDCYLFAVWDTVHGGGGTGDFRFGHRGCNFVGHGVRSKAQAVAIDQADGTLRNEKFKKNKLGSETIRIVKS